MPCIGSGDRRMTVGMLVRDPEPARHLGSSCLFLRKKSQPKTRMYPAKEKTRNAEKSARLSLNLWMLPPKSKYTAKTGTRNAVVISKSLGPKSSKTQKNKVSARPRASAFRNVFMR